MNTGKNAQWIGILFLIAMVASLLGGGLVESVLSTPDVEFRLRASQSLVIAGTLLELVNALAVIGIGVLFFPTIKHSSETLARGYLAIRVVEAVFCSAIAISPLSLIAILQNSSGTGAVEVSQFHTLAALSMAERASVMGLLVPVFFGAGALLLYTGLYQSRLLPRFITVWGWVAVVLMLINNLLLTFQVEIGLGLSIVLVLPMIANEVFLGIWLIIKGFNSTNV